jgi:hypothetical protein
MASETCTLAAAPGAAAPYSDSIVSPIHLFGSNLIAPPLNIDAGGGEFSLALSLWDEFDRLW